MNFTEPEYPAEAAEGSAAPRTIEPLGEELAGRLRAIAATHCEHEGGCHGPDHAERVLATALRIGSELGARLDILSIAALLHDIGRDAESRSRGRLCHAALGAEMAGPILLELGLAEEDIAAVSHCIATHRFRASNPPLTLEARVLFDADKLDSLGAVGIGRAFLFAGQVGARLHNDDEAVAGSRSYSLEDTAYREFMVKLRHLRGRMLTGPGRRLAEERHRFMELFFNRLDEEIWGGKLDGKES